MSANEFELDQMRPVHYGSGHRQSCSDVGAHLLVTDGLNIIPPATRPQRFVAELARITPSDHHQSQPFRRPSATAKLRLRRHYHDGQLRPNLALGVSMSPVLTERNLEC